MLHRLWRIAGAAQALYGALRRRFPVAHPSQLAPALPAELLSKLHCTSIHNGPADGGPAHLAVCNLDAQLMRYLVPAKLSQQAANCMPHVLRVSLPMWMMLQHRSGLRVDRLAQTAVTALATCPGGLLTAQSAPVPPLPQAWLKGAAAAAGCPRCWRSCRRLSAALLSLSLPKRVTASSLTRYGQLFGLDL